MLFELLTLIFLVSVLDLVAWISKIISKGYFMGKQNRFKTKFT